MSTQIVHELKFVRVPRAELGLDKDLFALMMLSGSSNTYAGWGANSKRARDWGMAYLGCESDMVAWAIARASDFAGGCAVWRSMGVSGRISPQQWISKIRKSLRSSEDVASDSLDSESATAGDLAFATKGARAAISLREAFKEAYAFTLEKPGDPTWHFLKVTGPGAT